jgi:muconolactone delta-isomerase
MQNSVDEIESCTWRKETKKEIYASLSLFALPKNNSKQKFLSEYPTVTLESNKTTLQTYSRQFSSKIL